MVQSPHLRGFSLLLGLALAYGAWLGPKLVEAQEPTPTAGEAKGGLQDPPRLASPRDGSTPNTPSAGAVSAPGKPALDRGTVLRLLLRANPMLWPLVLGSVITLGYALERLLALRRERVIPTDFVNRFLERLSAGKLDRDRALELCKAHDSPAARIFALVVKAWGQPGVTIRQTLSYDAAGEIIELKRNLRVLNAMATIGPLLGLLGTVVGIIQSFDALGGRVGPAKGEVLAHGISLALVATAFGLVIAIFAVVSYYYFLNRVDLLVRELDDRAQRPEPLALIRAPERPRARWRFRRGGRQGNGEDQSPLDLEPHTPELWSIQASHPLGLGLDDGDPNFITAVSPLVMKTGKRAFLPRVVVPEFGFTRLKPFWRTPNSWSSGPRGRA